MNFGAYEAGGFYDEMFNGGRGAERSEYSEVKKLFEILTEEDFKESRSKSIRKIRPWNEFFRSTQFRV